MEYNYTREFNQPIKFYTFPNGTAIPYAKNGVRLDYLVLTGVLIVVGFVIFLISLYTKINFIQSVYKNGWLIKCTLPTISATKPIQMSCPISLVLGKGSAKVRIFRLKAIQAPK